MSAPPLPLAPSRCFVVLPGMEGSGTTQARLVDALARHGAVHALSYPPDRICSYDQLAAELSWPAERHVIVASSYGGPLALRMAIAAPERVTAVVLLGSFGAAPVPFGRALSPLASLLFRKPPPRSGVQRALGKGADTALVDIAHAAVSRPLASVMQARLREVLRVDLRDALAELKQPVLYLRGAEDRLIGGRGLKTLAAVPRLTTRTVATGHFMALTEPEACTREIVSFLSLHD